MAFCSPLLSECAIVLPTWYLKTIVMWLVINSRNRICWSVFNAGFVCKHNTSLSLRCSDHRRKQQLLVTGGCSFNVMKVRQQGRAFVCCWITHCHYNCFRILGTSGPFGCFQQLKIYLKQQLTRQRVLSSNTSTWVPASWTICISWICVLPSYHLRHGKKHQP